MKAREAEFIEGVKATIFCGTYNVNAKKAGDNDDIADWLMPKKATLYDVYAVGFQEIVDLNAVNVVVDGTKSQQRAQYWKFSIMECLDRTKTKYKMVAEKHLVGLLLCVFVKETLAPKVRDIRTADTRVGLMGVMANKGGVCVRMTLYDSSLCFVCSHLAAHREKVHERNADFKAIVEKTVFSSEESIPFLAVDKNRPTQFKESSTGTRKPRIGAERSVGQDVCILDHDVVFWVGDLNYRIDGSLTTEEVFDKIKSDDLEPLREMDQLNIERAKRRAFQDFHEGVLGFAPTYKYQPGTDSYEQRSEKKLRAPAWCDRILWRVNKKTSTVRQMSYKRAKLMCSDHKPVSATFECSLMLVNTTKERKVYEELRDKLDGARSVAAPVVEIAGLQSHFDGLCYDVPSTSSLTLTNTGESIAIWRFEAKSEDARVSKRWVSFSAQKGLLFPGENVEVVITAKVDRRAAQLLNTGRETLDDIIVLKIEHSQEYYVTITGEYLRSCYGVLLEELVYMQQPVRLTRLPASIPVGDEEEELDEHEMRNRQQLESGTAQQVPKEVWRLIDLLWSGGALQEMDLFSGSSDSGEVAAIRESLDCGSAFGPCTPHSVVEALLSLLAALPRPLLPRETYPQNGEEIENVRSWAKKFLEALPNASYNVFIYVLSFLREVLAESDYNRTTVRMLSKICVSVMMHSPLDTDISADEKSRRESQQEAMQDVISYLLTTDQL